MTDSLPLDVSDSLSYVTVDIPEVVRMGGYDFRNVPDPSICKPLLMKRSYCYYIHGLYLGQIFYFKKIYLFI